MNPQTHNLIERPYQEVVDDVLVALVGGVVNEPIIFDVKSELYPLAQPAQGVRGIIGTLEIDQEDEKKALRYSFQLDIDFIFNASQNAVEWLETGKQPKDESIFYVDYFRPNNDSPLTDINVGSVTRTISEAISREIATVYGQVNHAYLSGFIDTAQGTALDLVVAILGIKRLTAEFAVGLVTFFRDPGITGNITIPEGIALTTSKGEVRFRTTQTRNLQRGQVRIDVPIRAADGFSGDLGIVNAGTITELDLQIAGINRTHNFDTTLLANEDESDSELRARAKAVLRSLGKATLAALQRVISEEQRSELVEVWDPNSPPDHQSTSGTAVLLVDTQPERFASLRGAVEETRAAGVHVSLIARYIFMTPHINIILAKDLRAAGQLKVKNDIIFALQSFIDGLGSGDAVTASDMLKVISEVEDVSEATVLDVLTWRTDLTRSSSETLAEHIVNSVTQFGTEDQEQLLGKIISVLSEQPPLLPTGRRIPDRSVIQGLDESAGQPATDAQIEKGEFQIVPTINNEQWSVALDMSPADIVFKEAES